MFDMYERPEVAAVAMRSKLGMDTEVPDLQSL